MFTHLDHLIVAVDDLKAAAENYQKLFGMEPVWSGEHKELGTSNALFTFNNTYFEILSATGEGLGADLVNQYLNQRVHCLNIPTLFSQLLHWMQYQKKSKYICI